MATAADRSVNTLSSTRRLERLADDSDDDTGLGGSLGREVSASRAALTEFTKNAQGLQDDAASPSPDDVRAQLGTVASGLAEQLSSITEEMNTIRQELYGDSGIGGIAKELEKLKTGNLNGLLDRDALDGALGDLGKSSGSPSGLIGSLGPSKPSTNISQRGGASAGLQAEVTGQGCGPRSRRSAEDDLQFEELKRSMAQERPKKGSRRNEPSASTATSGWEKVILVFLAVIFVYSLVGVTNILSNQGPAEPDDDDFYF